MKNEVYSRVIRAGVELAKHKIAETELPWRKYRTPYRIFLAEMLLVRTRVDMVARLFEQVVARYPTVYSLASANEEELGLLLRPLGFFKRIPLLIRAARYICERHGGEIPHKVEELLKVPGVGPYTAVAVATFAYGRDGIPADVNVLRFISRLAGLEMQHPTKGSVEARELLSLLSERNVGLSAENLLDFARLICKPRQPKCRECPVRSQCSYFRNNYSEV
ncbi:MAG: A/G-specific adenine glycosylase [Thermacetogenium sp.]|nr:A/G-specific adenine glycosylase [Thermacetogenium sp.]